MNPEWKVVSYEFGEHVPLWLYTLWLYITFPVYTLVLIPTVYHNIRKGYNYWFKDTGDTLTHYCVNEKDAQRLLWFEWLTLNKAFITDDWNA
jgi:hypothetical protein